jgi:hypothetical protein
LYRFAAGEFAPSFAERANIGGGRLLLGESRHQRKVGAQCPPARSQQLARPKRTISLVINGAPIRDQRVGAFLFMPTGSELKWRRAKPLTLAGYYNVDLDTSGRQPKATCRTHRPTLRDPMRPAAP